MNLLWTDFLNSHWHDWRGSGRSEDRLDNAEWLESFLQIWNLTAPIPPSPEELQELKHLRHFLHQSAEKLAKNILPSQELLNELNGVLSKGPVVRVLRHADFDQNLEIEWRPLHSNWSQIMAEIGFSFADTLAKGEALRIRFCDNPDCLWVFYDDTRNRSKRYCDDKLCGNLMKVRRFRSRKKG